MPSLDNSKDRIILFTEIFPKGESKEVMSYVELDSLA